MRFKKHLMAMAGAVALLFPGTVLLAAQLHEPHVGTIGEFTAGVGGECTWHFVHNQITFQKGQLNPDNSLTATIGGVVHQVEPFKRNKKVDHFDIVTISSDPVFLTNASSIIPEGNLVLSDVSCVEVEPNELLSCQCWNDFTADELFTSALDKFNSANTCQILTTTADLPDEGLIIRTPFDGAPTFLLEARPEIDVPGCVFYDGVAVKNIPLTKTEAQTCFSELTTLAAKLEAEDLACSLNPPQ